MRAQRRGLLEEVLAAPADAPKIPRRVKRATVVEAAAELAADKIASVITLPSSQSQPAPEPAEPGPVELGVIAECAALPASKRMPSYVETARRSARGLDSPKLATSHSAMAKQLRETMEQLRTAGVGRANRLQNVARLSQRASDKHAG
jgi:hypothetical protein